MKKLDRPFAFMLAVSALLLPAICLAGAITGKVTADGPASKLVVYLEKAPERPGPAVTPTVKQKSAQFEPQAVVMVKGQKLDFPNEDKIYHNVFSMTAGNDFDLGMYRGGESKSTILSSPGEVDVYCNVHPDMTAKIQVLDNGYFTETEPGGAYSLKDVPDGSYMLVAWSPPTSRRRRRSRSRESARMDFQLHARKGSKAHLNKNGEQYGRYK